jgi:hypothetical protein
MAATRLSGLFAWRLGIYVRMAVLTTTRARTHAAAGTIVMLILVLVFGNQAYAEWADKHAQGQTGWQLFLRTLSWPRWSATSGSSTARDFLAMDLRPLLLIVFTAALIGLTHHAAADWIGGLMVGWFTVIIGGALAALITALITTNATFYGALQAALQAAGYGLLVGWIVGIVLGRVRRSAPATN